MPRRLDKTIFGHLSKTIPAPKGLELKLATRDQLRHGQEFPVKGDFGGKPKEIDYIMASMSKANGRSRALRDERQPGVSDKVASAFNKKKSK